MSSIREQAEKIVRETILVVPGKIANRYVAAIEQALRDERERALIDAARQECVFCAGVEGYNATPVKANDGDGYVHRLEPPNGLAGIYCKAPRIRALMSKED